MEVVKVDGNSFQVLHNKDCSEVIIRVACEVYHSPTQICYDYIILV